VDTRLGDEVVQSGDILEVCAVLSLVPVMGEHYWPSVSI
jgi:hypothetical protein